MVWEDKEIEAYAIFVDGKLCGTLVMPENRGYRFSLVGYSVEGQALLGVVLKLNGCGAFSGGSCQGVGSKASPSARSAAEEDGVPLDSDGAASPTCLR
jgi:hypothetical protein